MKVRQFKEYNQHIIRQLTDIFNAHPEFQERIKTQLHEAKIRQKNRKRREERARKARPLANLPDAISIRSELDADQKPDATLPLENTQKTEPEPDNAFGNTYYFHVKSHSHLRRHFFESAKVKEIISGECIHYARVCKVGILHYAIMSNHLHLLVVIDADSYKNARKQVAKMIGCIKQQFTNRYKGWFNEELRVSKNYRVPPLETGSLWDRPAKIELLEDEVDLAACTLLIEANWLRDTRFQEINSLSQSPEFIPGATCPAQPEPASTAKTTPPTSMFQPCYNDLARSVAEHKHQSIPWYLNGGKGHPSSALTDGSDANWAPPDEFERLWPLAVRDLPSGYRKCWFQNMLGIIKPTPQKDRRFHISPFIEQLGETGQQRAEQLVYLVLNLCWMMGASRYREPLEENKQMGI